MDDELWDLMTDRDKLNAYECACQDLAKANARLAEAARELDEARQYVAEADAQLDAAAQDTADAGRRLNEQAEHVGFYANLCAHLEMKRRDLDERREFYKDELAKAQVCADEMAALAWKWKYKADCQRETIRALVVAARSMWWAIHQMASEDQRAYFRGLAKTEAIFMRRFGVTSDREAGDAVMKIWNDRAERVNAREASNG